MTRDYIELTTHHSTMAIVTSSEIGGYKYSFIDTPPNRLVCNICHFPSKNPYLTTCCGHVFCKSCLDDYKKYVSLKKGCPVCRQEKFVACQQAS